LSPKKNVSLKLLGLRIPKEIPRASKRNEIPTIKSVELDLALVIGIDLNLTTL